MMNVISKKCALAFWCVLDNVHPLLPDGSQTAVDMPQYFLNSRAVMIVGEEEHLIDQKKSNLKDFEGMGLPNVDKKNSENTS